MGESNFTLLRDEYLQLVADLDLDELGELELLDEFAAWANARMDDLERLVACG